MGGCCSTDLYRRKSGGYFGDDFVEKEYYEEDEEDEMRYGDSGARIRLKGSSSHTSMYTQQGRKGINQDAMTIWESFTGESDMFLCGVFDGHGPYGHKVARHVRDNLPSKLSRAAELSKLNNRKYGDFDLIDNKVLTSVDNRDGRRREDKGNNGDDDRDCDDYGSTTSDDRDDRSIESARVLPLSSWEACFIKSFKEMDEDLRLDPTIDSFCSGSTAVTVVKQGDNLIIANLGDSRAILCTRGDKNQLVPIQLTVDLKPDIPSEAERIRSCKGRVFAADEEPDVYRLWMPDEDCPGLAMARAFGDFCLKDYGLISIPDVSHRRITSSDEFVVLATDGVWDALTNIEVVTIVASARRRSMAARMLVNRAVRAWKIKYPGCKVDDCAAVCLFLKKQPSIAKSSSQLTRKGSSVSGSEYYSFTRSVKSFRSNSIEKNPYDATEYSSQWDQWSALQGISRVNSMVKLPRFLSFRRSTSGFHEVAAH